MTLEIDIRKSLARLRQRWDRFTNASFRNASRSATHDEMAGGEFISAFISESDLSFPRAGEKPKRGSARRTY